MTDGQWTSVTNSRHGNSRNNSSFGTRGGRTRPSYKTNSYNGNGSQSSSIKAPNELKKNSRYDKKNHDANQNPYQFPPNVDEFNLSHDENDNDSSDDGSGQENASLKPYDIGLSIKCPFVENCQDELLSDGTTLIEHLKELHQLCFVNLHHVYLILEKYLDNWAKRIKDDNVIQQLETEIDNKGIPFHLCNFLFFFFLDLFIYFFFFRQ